MASKWLQRIIATSLPPAGVQLPGGTSYLGVKTSRRVLSVDIA